MQDAETGNATAPTAELSVTERPDEHRWVLERDGEELGYAAYERTPGTPGIPPTLTIHSVVIRPELRGSGLGGILTQRVLDEVGGRGDERVVPACPFVARWIIKHPEYRELTSR